MLFNSGGSDCTCATMDRTGADDEFRDHEMDEDEMSCGGDSCPDMSPLPRSPSPCGSVTSSEVHHHGGMVPAEVPVGHSMKASFSIADILSPGAMNRRNSITTDNLKAADSNGISREDLEKVQDSLEHEDSVHPSMHRIPMDGMTQGHVVRPTAVRDSSAAAAAMAGAVPGQVSSAQWCAAGAAASAAAAYQYCYGGGQAAAAVAAAGLPGWPNAWCHPGFGRPPISGKKLVNTFFGKVIWYIRNSTYRQSSNNKWLFKNA